MSESTFDETTTVAKVLEEHPDPIPIFEQHGVNPNRDCGTNIFTIELRQTSERCFVDDANDLIRELNETMDA